MPTLVKALYTIIFKTTQSLVIPLYIKTIIGTWYFLVPTRKYPKKLSTGTALANHYNNSTQARKLAYVTLNLFQGLIYLYAQTMLVLLLFRYVMIARSVKVEPFCHTAPLSLGAVKDCKRQLATARMCARQGLSNP